MTTENVIGEHQDELYEDCIYEEESPVFKNDQQESKVVELSLVPYKKPTENQDNQEDQIVDDPILMIEMLIENLPDSFPLALTQIQNELAPLLAKCEESIIRHYIPVIKKKTKASNVHVIKDQIAIAKEKIEKKEAGEIIEDEIDPVVLDMVEQIKRDPLLFTKRIELISELGVVGERKAIALNFVVIDSRLLPLGTSSEALGLKHSGTYGSGKSYPMLLCLRLYSPSNYYLISSGSSKSLYNIPGGLKHKALILTEALLLQSENSGADNELAYAIRSLLSEGQLTYQYTGYVDGQKETIKTTLDGPTSLLTTTIHNKLERQLEDRLISIHPDESAHQSKQIVKRTADRASGKTTDVDIKVIQAWKVFHESLESIDVIVPFAPDIFEKLKWPESTPASVRRSFVRVVSAIKSVAIVYQFQRDKDVNGRLIAEMSDYYLVLQLINEAFIDSIAESFDRRDKRMTAIEMEGPITSKKLSELLNISGATISQWVKKQIANGKLKWVDKSGIEFKDEETLKTAKYSGNAYITVSDQLKLPSVFEITSDLLWDKEGELYKKYDLKIDRKIDLKFAEEDFKNEIAEESVEDLYGNKNPDKSDDGIRVLGENCENKKNNTVMDDKDDLGEQFMDILSDNRI